MIKSLIYSISFHSLMIILTVLSLPFMLREPVDLPPIVSVELIQISDVTKIPFAPKAAKILEKEGFKYIFNLKGGIISWKQKGNRIIKKESSQNLEISLNDFQEILSKNETVLVDIGAPWCGPCKEMYPIIKEIEKENIFDHVIFIDFDSNKDLRDFYNIIKIPTFIIFRDGEQIFRHLGTLSKQDLINKIY